MKIHRHLAACAILLASFSAAAATPAKVARLVIDYQKDPALCEAMLAAASPSATKQPARLHLPSDAESDLVAATWVDPGDFSNIRSLSHFELDDDDAIPVLGIHQRGIHDYSDAYFFGPVENLQENWREAPEYLFYESSAYVFPDSFKAAVHDCKDDSCPARYLVRAPGARAKTYSYRLTGLQVKPFVWHDVTYFLLTTSDAGQRHLATLVQPSRSRSAPEICLFRHEAGEAIELAPR